MTKTVFITGATAGFGEACARRFAAEGWRVIISGRRAERLEALRQSLAPAEVHAVTLDVRDQAAVNAAFANLPAPFDVVDVLVNNAGLALGLNPAPSCEMDDWETMVDTNVKGVMYCTRAVLPGMVERDRGHVVNVGSIAGTYPYPGGNVYGATKAFVKQFSRNLKSDLLGTRVRVSNIEPGMAETEFSVVRFEGDQGRADSVYQGMQPLQGADIADIVHWVVSAPGHVNINSVEVMPVAQAWGPFAVKRDQ